MVLPPIAAAPRPPRFLPCVALPGSDLGHQIKAKKPRPSLGLGCEFVEIELARWLVRNGAIWHAMRANARCERACIDAGERNDAARLEPGIKARDCTVVGGPRHVGAQHAAAHARAH